jgi:hypothetical protein
MVCGRGRLTMPKFKVTATMDVGYELIVEANSEDEAWELAGDIDIEGWECKGGQDWTLENVWKVDGDNDAN